MTWLGETIAFIPVRGGSKSIPLKNIKLINGRPLVYWVLDAAVDCMEIDRVVVSTDSDAIRGAVAQYGSDKVMVIDRSEAVSNDTASTESVMLEFTNQFDFKNLILIQATSPLLKSEHLSEGMSRFRLPDVDSVLSAVRQKRFIWQESGHIVQPQNYDPQCRPRRQEFSGYLVENGAFYITSRADFLSTQCRISGTISAVEMPEETYFELDEPSDWLIIENLLKKDSNNIHDLKQKIAKLKCLLTDCDGVLTDGGMYYSESGDELKKFNTKDGMGFQILREKGFITGIITGENSQIVKRRAAKLKLDICELGVANKLQKLAEICENYQLKRDEVAYIGDDLNDLEVLKEVGLACTVSTAPKQLQSISHYISPVPGGSGTVRDVIDLIISELGN